ncbi:hypothetical protein LTR50_003960 [Elasticomyces elasticus]|nr:hypothetical protein LTR50_003960 [Elasticomyces elasticus]
MRDIDEARQSWNRLDRYTSLEALKDAARFTEDSTNHIKGLRSVCWKVRPDQIPVFIVVKPIANGIQAFLIFDSIDRATWPRILANSRAAYVALRAHFLRAFNSADELEPDLDPLSDDTESPWATLRKDEELRAEILQDVERCMPENLYFRQPATQAMLLDVLFVFSKLNPDVSYRQGMHEVLAPILWVVERDAVNQYTQRASMGEDLVLRDMFDPQYIEHDTFALFSVIMQNAKTFYEQAAHVAPTSINTTGSRVAPPIENPMVARSHRIFDELLPLVDPDLTAHMKEIDIVPQVFLMYHNSKTLVFVEGANTNTRRWIRLLFGREFPFDDLLELWDLLFAEDPSLELVDLISLAMLLRIRWNIIEADYNTALTMLLRYPSPPSESRARTFVLDAIYLRNHLNIEGGSELVAKYTQRPPPPTNRLKARPSTIIKNNEIAPQSSVQRTPTPRRLQRRTSSIESVLQDATSVFTRGQGWTLNRTVRDALVEVSRNVHEKAQSLQTPQAPSFRPRNPSPATHGSSPAALIQKVSKLQDRNKTLAKMLEAAVADLWEHSKGAEMDGSLDNEKTQALSVAIAKVQFVQVYLEDPTIPLPSDEQLSGVRQKGSQTFPEPQAKQLPKEADTVPARKLSNKETGLASQPAGYQTASGKPKWSVVHRNETPEQKTPPSSSSAGDAMHSKAPERNATAADTAHAAPVIGFPPALAATAESKSLRPGPSTVTRVSEPPSEPHPFHTSRPSLSHSSFSWMLGQDKRPVSFVSAKPFPSQAREGKGFLFGDEVEEPPARSTATERKLKGKGKARGIDTKKKGSEEDILEEIFDLANLEPGDGPAKKVD